MWLATTTGDAVTSAATTALTATCVTGGTAHTKGSWAEVTAAATSEWSWFSLLLMAVNSTSATDTSTLLDVGIGGAGSEVVIVPNLAVGYGGSSAAITAPWLLPVRVPKGSRVAVRAQSVRTTQNIVVAIVPFSPPPLRFVAPSALVNLNANTGTSAGVTVTNPGSANTKGAWTEMTASVPQALQGLVIAQQGAQSNNVSNGGILVDIAVGASGSEVVVIPNIPLQGNSAEVIWALTPATFAVSIPAGARIAARYQRANTAPLDLTILGVPA